jgi:hypothetical protein
MDKNLNNNRLKIKIIIVVTVKMINEVIIHKETLVNMEASNTRKFKILKIWYKNLKILGLNLA